MPGLVSPSGPQPAEPEQLQQLLHWQSDEAVRKFPSRIIGPIPAPGRQASSHIGTRAITLFETFQFVLRQRLVMEYVRSQPERALGPTFPGRCRRHPASASPLARRRGQAERLHGFPRRVYS